MFNETHKNNNISLTFIKSSNVNAFPCGRRRSTLIHADVSGNTSIGNNEGYYIPFDPEARLNTEANNRRHSSLNGFTQTYLKSWNETGDGLLTLSIGGYLFTITLPLIESTTEYWTGTNFAEALLSAESTASKIYANIVLENVKLYSGSPKEYYTSVLAAQYAVGEQQNISLDLLKSNASSSELDNPDSFYFSGLSFSTTPITGDSYSDLTQSSTRSDNGNLLISLCILEKVEGVWKIHEPARLPLIEHDNTENSIVVGDTRIKRVADGSGNVVDNYNGDLTVEHNVTVANELYVGDADNNVTIKANPASGKSTLEVIGGAATDTINVNDSLTVGTISYTETEGKITILNTGANITKDGNAVISNNLTVGNKITTKSLTIAEDIAASSTTAEIITATEALYQGRPGKGGNNVTEIMQVPIIELDPVPVDDKTYYQLKISRIGQKPQVNN